MIFSTLALLAVAGVETPAQAAGTRVVECGKRLIDARVAADWPPMTTVQPVAQECAEELDAAKAEVIGTIQDGDKTVSVTAADLAGFAIFAYVVERDKSNWARSRAKTSWQRRTEEMADDELRLQRPPDMAWAEYHGKIRWHAEDLYYDDNQTWRTIDFQTTQYSDFDRIHFDFSLGGAASSTDGFGLYPYSDGERVFTFFRTLDQESGRVSWTRIVVARMSDDGNWHIVSARERWRCASRQPWTHEFCRETK